MIIKVNYSVTDIYMSTSVSPVYVKVVYSGNAAVAGVWGTITGTLSSQTDLQNALNAKVPTSRILTINGVSFDLSANRAWTLGTVTSVGLSMPNAFGVANSPITSSGTLAVTALGTASQYIRGDGALATFPGTASGGSAVSYYLNGGTSASVATYFQMSKTAVLGAAADFNLVGNGLIAQFLTDVADPNRLEIPAGNWNFELYFNISSSGGNTAFYVELLKYNGSTFTSIASSVGTPETITGGTLIDLYLTSLAIPQTTLLASDRLALRVYIVSNSGGRTVTLHTQNGHLCEIITNFAGGVSALNGITANTQYFATGTSGTNFGIVSSGDTHTFNLPTASATNRGALSSADWTTFNSKVPTSRTLTINGTTFDLSADRSWTIAAGITGSGVANQLTYWNGTGSVTGSSALTYVDSTGAFALSKSQNNPTAINITNATSGTSGRAGISLISNTASGQFTLQKYSTLHTAYKINLATDAILYNDTAGDISILNDFSTGKIKFASGGSSTAQMTLTAAGRLLLGTTTESTYILDVNGTARVSGGVTITEGINTLKSVGAFNINYNVSQAFAIWYGATAALAIGQNTVDGVGITQVSGTTYALHSKGISKISSLILDNSNNIYPASGTLNLNFPNPNDAYIYGGSTIRLAVFNTSGNVGVGNSNTDIASAILHASSTTKGFLPPRMTAAERSAISAATGLIVYQTDGTEGLYEKTSSAWRIINGGGGGSVDELQVALISQVYG